MEFRLFCTRRWECYPSTPPTPPPRLIQRPPGCQVDLRPPGGGCSRALLKTLRLGLCLGPAVALLGDRRAMPSASLHLWQ